MYMQVNIINKAKLRLKDRFDRIFKRGQYSPEAVKAGFQQSFYIILDKGNLNQTELEAVCQLSETYWQKFIVGKDGISLDIKEIDDYVWTIARSGAEPAQGLEIMGHLQKKYYPVSAVMH